jgi:hypothetical protein
MAQDTDEAERCRVVTEVAVERAMEKCGSEEAVREQLVRLVGLDEETDPDCEAALEEGLDGETLTSTRGTRQWVLCRAWQLVRDEEMTLSSATQKAWAEAKAEGDNQGIEV